MFQISNLLSCRHTLCKREKAQNVCLLVLQKIIPLESEKEKLNNTQ